MKIRTAIFGVYVAASAVALAVLMTLVLRDVRRRYVESMRRTLGDTAAFLAVFVAADAKPDGAWARRLTELPPNAELLRVFASDRDGRVIFDSAQGRDVGQSYSWPMTGGGPVASERYSLTNVAEVDGELRVRTPVRATDGELLGWIGVGRQLATVTAGVRQARTGLLWSAVTIAAVMVAAGWYIASRLTHSLERLTDYAEAVRDGRTAVPPESRAKEIATLGRAFEEMRVTLEGKAHVERYTQALAHEFKAPLSAIRGAAELLGENPPEPERTRFLANLRLEAERLRLIVDRLLELAALETRRSGAVMAKVNVATAGRKICDAAQPTATARRIALTWTSAAEPAVRGESFLLEQAISNLVQNALDFTPSGGVVTVSLRVEHASAAVVTVEDTGAGVPDYALGKIFERFYSLPRPDTGRKSSGLGLSIVREIARLHGGEVTLENRSEGGVRAVLTLPLA